MKYPAFKQPMMKIPRNGWNYTVGSYKFTRDTYEDLVDAVRKYLESEGESAKGIERAITEHICEENPLMCHWIPEPETQADQTQEPRKTLAEFMDWMKNDAILKYNNSAVAKQRIEQCAKCPYNDKRETLGVASRIIWSKHTPDIRMGQCKWHKHDNAIAAWIENLIAPNGKPDVECWLDE